LGGLQDEFDRQLENLIQKQYHVMAGIRAGKFVASVEPLPSCGRRTGA
jgi:hypothetical protein